MCSDLERKRHDGLKSKDLIMFGLIVGLGVAAAAGIFGHMSTRNFVGRRLRFTSIVEKPSLGLAAGAVATAIALPVVAVLPIVTVTTAIVFGAGVGTGAALGAKDAKRPLLED